MRTSVKWPMDFSPLTRAGSARADGARTLVRSNVRPGRPQQPLERQSNFGACCGLKVRAPSAFTDRCAEGGNRIDSAFYSGRLPFNSDWFADGANVSSFPRQ